MRALLISSFHSATGGDEELLRLTDYLRENNEQWADPELVAAVQNGQRLRR